MSRFLISLPGDHVISKYGGHVTLVLQETGGTHLNATERKCQPNRSRFAWHLTIKKINHFLTKEHILYFIQVEKTYEDIMRNNYS